MFTWKDGRKLATLTKGNTSVSYKYNSDGIRYEKTVNGIVHKYYLMGSTITAETIIDGNTTTKIEYFYDPYGAYGFSIDGTFYYYVKNLQGDVTQIRDASNGLVASYSYDAWGRVLNVTENNTNNIGSKNAIRYRGYYYDTESNLYYLNARYYDPQIKRFISADDILGANGDIIGYNVYAYCNNIPTVFIDESGNKMVYPVNNESLAMEWWVKKIVYDVAEDIENFDSDNQDVNKVYDSHYFSSYKGAFVVRIKSDILTSWNVCKTIYLNHNYDEFSHSTKEIILNHEYGHYIKKEEIGTASYLVTVALPSITYNAISRAAEEWLKKPWLSNNYYNMPWEYNADLNAGIVRPDHKQWAQGLHDWYWRTK